MLRRSRPHVPAGEGGITVVEVLVATVVVGVGLIALAMVVPLSAYGVHEGRALSSATFLAEQRLEEVRNAGWSAGPDLDCLGMNAGGPPESTRCTRGGPSPCSQGTTCVTFPDEPGIAGFPGYTRTVRATACDAGPGCASVLTTDQRLVRVTVTYRPMSGAGGLAGDRGKPVVLEMIVAKRQ